MEMHFPLPLTCPVADCFQSGTCNYNTGLCIKEKTKKTKNRKLMNKFTGEMTHLVSRPPQQLSPPVPSALYELKTPTQGGHGLGDKHPAGSDDVKSNKSITCKSIK